MSLIRPPQRSAARREQATPATTTASSRAPHSVRHSRPSHPTASSRPRTSLPPSATPRPFQQGQSHTGDSPANALANIAHALARRGDRAAEALARLADRVAAPSAAFPSRDKRAHVPESRGRSAQRVARAWRRRVSGAAVAAAGVETHLGRARWRCWIGRRARRWRQVGWGSAWRRGWCCGGVS